MQTKNKIENQIDEIQALSENCERKLKAEFQKVIDNPSESRVKKYQDYETALLALYARELYKAMSEKVSQYMAIGKASAITQLLKKGYSKENISAEVFNELRKAQRRFIKASIQKVIASIKQNSRNNILQMRQAFILEKKRLAEGFLGVFNKYGVAYFNDARGAKWTLARYTEMLSTNTIASVQRESFFATSLEMGNDLVKIIHLNLSPECELCAPFNGKVLSISGQTKGYMSVAQAENCGLFHISCDHITEALELSPEKEYGDNLISLSKGNEKSLKKNGVNLSAFKRKSFIAK